jgi:hypothetical protein
MFRRRFLRTHQHSVQIVTAAERHLFGHCMWVLIYVEREKFQGIEKIKFLS